MHASPTERLSASILINMGLWILASVAGQIYIGYMFVFLPGERDGRLLK